MFEFLIVLGFFLCCMCTVFGFMEGCLESFIGSLIGFIMFCVGIICIEPDYADDYKKYATQEEIIIVETINSSKYNICSVNAYPVREAIFNRGTGTIFDKPFSDIESVVKFYDNSLICEGYKVTTIQGLYKQVYDKELFGAVPSEIVSDKTVALEEAITPTPEQLNTQVIDSTVTIKEETLLSPDKVRELNK